MKKRMGDRYDGRWVRNAPTFTTIVPYIMTTRNDSQVQASLKVDVTNIDEYTQKRRQNKEKHFSFLELLMAAVVRTVSQRPYINRFVAGNRVYARDKIQISIAIKKSLSVEAEETAVKIEFLPTDTIFDVSQKVREEIFKNKDKNVSNKTDNFAKVLNRLPWIVMKTVVGAIKAMDFFGVMPKKIHELSPFHSSVFITDMGSIGFAPIYHHIYNFGTVTCFISFGARFKERVINEDGSISEKKFIEFKIVGDERVSDGVGMTAAWKEVFNYLQHPELLEVPPEKVVEDPYI